MDSGQGGPQRIATVFCLILALVMPGRSCWEPSSEETCGLLFNRAGSIFRQGIIFAKLTMVTRAAALSGTTSPLRHTEACKNTKDRALCRRVSVDCIYEGPDQLYIPSRRGASIACACETPSALSPRFFLKRTCLRISRNSSRSTAKYSRVPTLRDGPTGRPFSIRATCGIQCSALNI